MVVMVGIRHVTIQPRSNVLKLKLCTTTVRERRYDNHRRTTYHMGPVRPHHLKHVDDGMDQLLGIMQPRLPCISG